ncbi:NTP pyrophosphohydrolaseincluding oxidative damage repair enzyme [Pseudomonas synxantha]|uniref:NTP pyrophosphohydrolaseincluding oxidative damage repair enzyme n=1 Tax=Pseudomonas synxantha TaxID=47883 RepID=A0AAX3I8A3_9PSED|nr:NTP pyrophosphohydrolase [Pseudomonas synxantha]VTQ99537.1 NTP pyrophosphohydrolaseincluding oxidative damage repair enzyme [Pseudomonas synxantha]
MQDTFNLSRFVEAQRPVFSRVMDELRAGRKTSHWMWFVFPQLRGLGRSDMAGRFAICSCLPRA